MYKALVSFVGKISMVAGELREIPDSPVAMDLLNAGYVEEVAGKEKKKKGETKNED